MNTFFLKLQLMLLTFFNILICKIDFSTLKNSAGRNYPQPFMQQAINKFLENNGKIIVEIGSMRGHFTHDVDNETCHFCSDGHSTYFLARTNAKFYTVDLNPENISICKDVCKKFNNVIYNIDDGINFLKNFNQKIDFLFLDAWDVYDPQYSEKHLEVYKEAKDKLNETCLILIDDTDIDNNGKGRLLIPEAIKDGFKIVFQDRQTLLARNAKKIYDLKKDDPIDVVIACHEKDVRTLDLCINGIKNNCKNIGKIYVISAKKLTENPNSIWIDEAKFPFNRYDISLEIFENNKEEAEKFSKGPRIGWIFKQIMNLYAPIIIENISSNVLILDADTIFLHKVEFIDENGNALYNPGTEYVPEYFQHAQKLIKGENKITKVFGHYSGISHHQLFQKAIIEDLFKQMSNSHNRLEPWKIFARCMDKNKIYESPMAETEIYFNFAFANTNQVKIRKLNWENVKWHPHNIINYTREGSHYISCHTHMDCL